MKRTTTVVVFMLLTLGLLAACAQEPEPKDATPDLGAVKTQAVQTAVSQMTADAASAAQAEPQEEKPTITPLTPAEPAAEEAQPTATTITSGGSTSSGGSTTYSSGTPIPTWTPVVYGCEVVGQSPLDGNQYVGENLDVTWTLKNTGAATWKAGVYYYYWTGYDDLSPVTTIMLAQDVAPYQTVQVMIDVDVPVIPGQYRTQWYLVNDNGADFCGFYYYVNAIPLPTATPD